MKPVFATAAGAVTGSFTHPTSNKAQAFTGVVLQKGPEGRRRVCVPAAARIHGPGGCWDGEDYSADAIITSAVI